jgi:uroporphyrin-III C-methyltransferase
VTGSVHLVGAGPGDPDLLTVRALRLLETAEVVAYDELVSPAVLALAAPDAERLPVGRRHGQGAVPYRVHPLVIERALAGRRVVRLKTGDPFVFGRGGEELEELAEHGIAAEVVPGITAALGAAAATGIPLTHRGVASAVTFVTGHDGARVVAGLPPGCTVVLYMAAHGLARCVDDLIAGGRSPHTPAAIIAAATTPRQRVIAGTLGDLADRGAEVGDDPALVVIGDVVALGTMSGSIAALRTGTTARREVA